MRRRISPRMRQNIHRRNHAAMAPPNHSYALRVQKSIVLQHPLPRLKHILNFQPAIINLVIKPRPITGAPAIIWPDHRIALLHQFPYRPKLIIATEIAMDSLVRKNNRRILRPRRSRIFRLVRRRTRIPDLIHFGNITQLCVPLLHGQRLDQNIRTMVPRPLNARSSTNRSRTGSRSGCNTRNPVLSTNHKSRNNKNQPTSNQHLTLIAPAQPLPVTRKQWLPLMHCRRFSCKIIGPSPHLPNRLDLQPNKTCENLVIQGSSLCHHPSVSKAWPRPIAALAI